MVRDVYEVTFKHENDDWTWVQLDCDSHTFHQAILAGLVVAHARKADIIRIEKIGKEV